MQVYDVSEQTISFNEKDDSYQTIDVLDQNGLLINVEISVKFYIEYEKIGYIHEQFGENYIQYLIVPEVRSEVRKIMGHYTAEEIYSTKKQEIEEEIISKNDSILKENNINMVSLKIDSIILPPKIMEALNKKEEQKQNN